MIVSLEEVFLICCNAKRLYFVKYRGLLKSEFDAVLTLFFSCSLHGIFICCHTDIAFPYFLSRDAGLSKQAGGRPSSAGYFKFHRRLFLNRLSRTQPQNKLGVSNEI